MSDHVGQSTHDSDRTSRQFKNHCQSAWMGRWKLTGCNSNREAHNHLPLRNLSNEDGADSKKHPVLGGTEVATDASKSSQEFKEVSEGRTVEIMNDSKKNGAMKLEKEVLDIQPFPMFKICRGMESPLALENDGSDPFRPKHVLYNQELVKTHTSPEKFIVAASSSSWNDLKLSSKTVPYRFSSEDAPISEQQENEPSGSNGEPKEHATDTGFCSYSTLWVHEKKSDYPRETRNVGTSVSRKSEVPLLYPPSSNSPQPTLMRERSAIKLLSDQSCQSEGPKSGNLFHNFFLLPKISRSVRDVETMRIYTTIDSVEKFPRVPPKFSQTTHQFFIEKKTNFNLSEEPEMPNDSKLSEKLKGSMFSEFLSLSPTLSFDGPRGVKLEPLKSSADNEGKENVGDVKTPATILKSETSAKTDSMEFGPFQKSHLSGLGLLPSNQNTRGPGSSLSSRVATTSAKDITGDEISPDINEELPALPTVASALDDRETSTSRTQSLDAEHLLSHAEHPTILKSSTSPDAPSGLEPTSRWVKRLKLSTSDSFVHGTQSCKMEEASSHEKLNKIFGTSSEHTSVKYLGKPQVALNQGKILLKNSSSSSTDSARKSQEITLSHPWLQRWCRDGHFSLKMKPQSVMPCDPRSLDAKVDEYGKKQFPSIAAMALMGKAMTGFHRCEIKKKGPLMIWNT